ncbi:MAG: heavy metal efflux pump, CzcA family [Myxococcaceae bacterium]|nr:heavy metal efflux pump, CzcA family [Myxococcaceae bacterium]
MIERLALFAVERRWAVVSITLVLAALALWPALQLPLDALPDLTNNQVIVLTLAPGLSPEEVELTVTRPLEVALSGSADLREQRSISRYGISSVTAVFEDRVDAFRARQMVAERLRSVRLPAGVGEPELAPLTGGLGEVFHVTLSSALRTPAELLELTSLRVAPLLKAVPGIVEVNTWGGAQRTLDVIASPTALANHDLTLEQLRRGLLEAAGASPGGALDSYRGQVLLRAQARPRNASELAAALVGSPPVRVGELAEVRDGTALRLGAATANGRGETVYLMAQMLRDQNALEVLDRVHARMVAVRAALPADVRIDVVYDRSVLVRGALHTVFMNLLEGGTLVGLVLFAFLGSWRAGLVAASVIPLSMVLATAVMSLLDLPGNLMSLGALDFGLLVDGAIVLVEGAFHGAPSEPSKGAWLAHVRKVTSHAARPVFFSVLVILLVYVPVLSLSGTDGKLFRPMALTVVLALFFSLCLSMTWVPALLALGLGARDVPQRPPLLVRVLEHSYPRAIERLLPRPTAVALVALLLVVVGVLVARTRGVEFTPQLDEGDMVVQTTRAPDISLAQALHDGRVLERVLRERVPEVLQVVSRVGSPAVATDIMGFEQADVFIKLKPRAQWRSGLEREALVVQMQRALAAHAPGAEPSFTQPIQMRFNELLGGAVTDVAVSVYGDDLSELRRQADALARAFSGVHGAVDVRVLAPPAVPLATVRPRPLAASQVGLSAQEVLDATQAVRVGLEFGQTWEGALRIPLRLLLSASSQSADLPELALPVHGGGLVPLSQVAEVELSDAPGLVNRRDGQRRLVVGFNVRGADLGSVVHAAQAAARTSVPLPRGYRLEWGGQYENLTAAAERLALIIPCVLIAVLALLIATFGHLRTALSVFLVVPVAAVGGVLALALRGMPVSLPAAIGFIALTGIAVMNGVVWMARAHELERSLEDVTQIARRAALERARPVLMTALVAALGFVPMMLSHGIGAEVQRPLATVVVGGLFSSTVLTLFVLPVLYPFLRGPRQKRAP